MRPVAARHLLRLSALVCGVLLAGCTGRAEYLAEALAPVAEVRTFRLQNEEFRLVSVTTGDAPAMRALYFVGGSGCTALSAYLATYVRDLPPGYLVFGLDKAGVAHRSLGLACSPAFRDTDTLDQLIRRNAVGLSLARQVSPVPVAAVLGVSEGGIIAATLAADVPGVDRLVMLAAGGMTQREGLILLAADRGQAAGMERQLARVAGSPDSTTDRVLGLPHRYWSSVLDLDPAATLQRVSQPALIVIGSEDRSVPVASARRAADLLPEGRLVVIPGASHTFQTPEGSRRAAVMALVDDFLRREGPVRSEPDIRLDRPPHHAD